jgi:hypothetical protein
MYQYSKPVEIKNGMIQIGEKSYSISNFDRFEVGFLNESPLESKYGASETISSSVKPIFVTIIILLLIEVYRMLFREQILYLRSIIPDLIIPDLNRLSIILPLSLLIAWTKIMYYIIETVSKPDNLPSEVYYLCLISQNGKFFTYGSSDKSEIESYVNEIYQEIELRAGRKTILT